MLKYSVWVVIVSLSFSSVIAGIPDDVNAELAQQLRNECVRQSGVDESLIHAANNNGGLADDDKLKCYLRCTYVESGTLYDNGDVNQEAVLAVMPESAKPILKRIFETCGTKKGIDDCDTIYQTHRCYYEMNPDLYFII